MCRAKPSMKGVKVCCTTGTYCGGSSRVPGPWLWHSCRVNGGVEEIWGDHDWAMSGLAATSPSESADRGLLRSQISARVTSRDTLVIHAFSCAFNLNFIPRGSQPLMEFSCLLMKHLQRKGFPEKVDTTSFSWSSRIQSFHCPKIRFSTSHNVEKQATKKKLQCNGCLYSLTHGTRDIPNRLLGEFCLLWESCFCLFLEEIDFYLKFVFIWNIFRGSAHTHPFLAKNHW